MPLELGTETKQRTKKQALIDPLAMVLKQHSEKENVALHTTPKGSRSGDLEQSPEVCI